MLPRSPSAPPCPPIGWRRVEGVRLKGAGMSVEAEVADHYGGGELLRAIAAGVEAIGKTPDTVSLADLAPADEFHIGGRPATTELGERLGISADMELLDLGCGIGGASRFFASTFGCLVTGLDLTPDYIEVARSLTEWTGLEDGVQYEIGSVLDMPFDDATFDCATQLHLGMNIADKPALFAEVHRVLRPGGRFGVYDILRLEDAAISYPVPWAASASTSFVEDLPAYRDALEGAGFVVMEERDRREFALEFFETLRDRMQERGGPPPLGLHLVMGSDAAQKISNMVDAVAAGTVAPVEIIAQRPEA